MLTDEEFPEIVEELTNSNPAMRATMLEVLWDDPAADRRILPYLENLLDDQKPALIGIPFVFAEIRWLAAHALAAERATLGIQVPVYLPSVVPPLDTGGIVRAEYAAGINARGGVDGLLHNFAILNEMGYLPRYELSLSYWINASTDEDVPIIQWTGGSTWRRRVGSRHNS